MPGGYVPIKFSITPDPTEVNAELLHIIAVLKDLRGFLRQVFLPEWLKDVQANIISEGDNVGGWDPTTKEYEDWKEARGGGDRMGIFSRKMFNSFSPGGRSQYLNVKTGLPGSMEVENTLYYTAWFNARRPVAPILDEAKYKKLFENWLEFEFAPKKGKKRIPQVYTEISDPQGPVLVSGGHIGRQRLRKKKPVYDIAKGRRVQQVEKLRSKMLAKALKPKPAKRAKHEEDELSRLIREQQEEMSGGSRGGGGFDDFTEFAGGYDEFGKRVKPGKKRKKSSGW